jgi:hypothetical protein
VLAAKFNDPLGLRPARVQDNGTRAGFFINAFRRHCDCDQETQCSSFSTFLFFATFKLRSTTTISTCFLFFNFFILIFLFFLQVVIFKIPYPGWTTAKIGSYALTEAFEKAANMPVVDVTVTGGGKEQKLNSTRRRRL